MSESALHRLATCATASSRNRCKQAVDADAYDVEIRRFIPHYDDMLATGVELLATLAPPTAHVLDLGGGTGALSAAVLGGLPEARVTVLDVDSEMLGEARRRLAPFAERVEFREAGFFDPLPAADAVVASLALHQVHDLGAKTDLYRAIHGALAPGSVFLNLDAAITADPRLNALTFDRWALRMAEHGITGRRGRRPLRRVGGRGPLLPAGRGAGCAAARGLRRGQVLLAPWRVGDLLRPARLSSGCGGGRADPLVVHGGSERSLVQISACGTKAIAHRWSPCRGAGCHRRASAPARRRRGGSRRLAGARCSRWPHDPAHRLRSGRRSPRGL
jgi:hypothetical protein